MLKNDQLDAWDRDFLMHPATHTAMHARGESPTRIVTRAEGVFIEDRDGRRFLDAFAGLYCVNVGYGRSEIADAIAEQARELAYYHTYLGNGNEAAITLAKMVIERAPDHMSRVYFGLGGSDANDTNLKMIWYYNNILGRPEKKKIISRWRAYHGSGLTSGSLTGLELFHKKFDLPLERFLHTTCPCFFRRDDLSMNEQQFTEFCVSELEEMIAREGADTIAAFVAEPMIGTGGIAPPSEGYWEKIQPVLEKHDILLVADEVITGFGRTGSMFGSDQFNIKPDIMTIAKGLTSAYAPLSGSIFSGKVWDVLEQGNDEFGPMGHGWTYSAHPIGAAAGVANLKLVDKLGLVDNARTTGAYLKAAMKDALGDHHNVGEIRGEGMWCAIELVEERERRVYFDPSKKVAVSIIEDMAGQNVIARAMPQADMIGIAPPLCLNKAEADMIVEATTRALHKILGE